jgi:hypothetical protein
VLFPEEKYSLGRGKEKLWDKNVFQFIPGKEKVNYSSFFFLSAEGKD